MIQTKSFFLVLLIFTSYSFAQSYLLPTETETSGIGSTTEQSSCLDRGCNCEAAAGGAFIPTSCYREPERCCSEDAPTHIRTTMAAMETIISREMPGTSLRCNRSDQNSEYIICNNDLYKKINSDDVNSLPARLDSHINNSNSNKEETIPSRNQSPVNLSSPTNTAIQE